MALTERQIVDLIEITENNTIQVRTATIVERDGVEIARTFHRHLLPSGSILTNEDVKIQAIANAIWI
jgi:hypothetical protein